MSVTIPQTSYSATGTAAIKGQLADNGFHDVVSYYSEEASEEMPFGVMLQQGTAVNGALLCNATDDNLIGILLHSNAYNQPNELGDEGLLPGMTLNVLRKGRVWVYAEEAVGPASTVLLRVVGTNGTPGDQVGDFRDTADDSDTIDCSAFARFITSTSGAGLAVIEIDMTGSEA